MYIYIYNICMYIIYTYCIQESKSAQKLYSIVWTFCSKRCSTCEESWCSMKLHHTPHWLVGLWLSQTSLSAGQQLEIEQPGRQGRDSSTYASLIPFTRAPAPSQVRDLFGTPPAFRPTAGNHVGWILWEGEPPHLYIQSICLSLLCFQSAPSCGFGQTKGATEVSWPELLSGVDWRSLWTLYKSWQHATGVGKESI